MACRQDLENLAIPRIFWKKTCNFPTKILFLKFLKNVKEKHHSKRFPEEKPTFRGFQKKPGIFIEKNYLFSPEKT